MCVVWPDQPPPNETGKDSDSVDPVKSARSARCRARNKVRRYCRHNRIRNLWTFTYREAAADADQVMADAAGVIRRLRERFGAIPYVYVVERGKKGRLHLHIGLAEYLPIDQVRGLWGLGFVHAARVRARGPREAAGVVAGYLAGYVAKSLDEVERGSGCHRYECAQGHQPTSAETDVETFACGDQVLTLVMGGPPASRWSSSDAVAWEGPPVQVLMWADP